MLEVIDGERGANPTEKRFVSKTALNLSDIELLSEAASDFKGLKVFWVVPELNLESEFKDEEREWTIFQDQSSQETSIYIAGTRKEIHQLFDRFFYLSD